MTAAEKEKRKPKFLRKIFESPKKRAERLSTKSGKANTAATKKMYAAESMFNSAKNRDDAKSTAGKAQSFGSAFKSARSSGKKTFLWKGKSYTTKTKSEAEAGSKMGKFKSRFSQLSK